MQRLLGTCIAVMGISALAAQYYLTLQTKEISTAEITLRYFTYFTILTNLIVFVYFISLLRSPAHGWRIFAERPDVSAGVTLYILVVGLVYQVALRHIWNPTGLQRIVDELLHTVIPFLVLVYWIAFASKKGLTWRALPRWLIYPLLYVLIVMVRGLSSGWYPYYFINIDTLGWTQVMIHALIIFAVFCVIGSLMIGFARSRK
jgi:hypothetical protein